MSPEPSFKQVPVQQQSQRTVLSKKHQLATELLQYPNQEVSAWLRERIQSNPVLEPEVDEEDGDLEEMLEELEEVLDRELDMPATTGNLTSPSGASFDQSMVSTPPEQERSLHDHLTFQVDMKDLPPSEQEILKRLIGRLDCDGRLPSSLEELGDEWNVPVPGLKRALSTLQELDPPGVGARNLAECIRLQFDGRDEEGPPAILLEEHLEDLQKGLVSRVARAMEMSEEEIQYWVDRIGELDPHPGRPFQPDDACRVQPEVFVRKKNSEWIVELEGTGRPSLNLNSHYRKLLLSGDREVRSYLSEKFNAVVWILRAILQREETLYRVSRSIVNHQLDFFEHGMDHLKPLVQSTVAEDIEVHESTVSRAVSDKYLQCNHGIFSLEFFFDSRVQSNGTDVSSTSVKQWIRELIDQENPRDPHSDNDIKRLLEEQRGVQLSRRTVAKYRKQMGLLSSRMRKRFDSK